MFEQINREVQKGLEKHTCNNTRNRQAICNDVKKTMSTTRGGNWDCIMGDYDFTFIERVQDVYYVSYQFERNEKLEIYICC